MERDRLKLAFVGHFFFSFKPPSKAKKKKKNQNSEKMQKIAGDIIILHMFTKNHDHMMQSCSDME